MAANSSVSDRVFQRHGRWRSMQEKEVYVDDDLDRRFSASKFLGLAMQAISFYLPRLYPILCIMGRDVGVYKTGYNTWLSSRLQNQPRSFRFVSFNFFLC